MGWGFRVTCPDCGREWEGVQTSYRFGPWSSLEHAAIGDDFRSWFCPRCFFRVHIPRAIERNVWRRWYAAFLAGPDAGYPFLRDLAARLDGILSEGRDDIPFPVDLEPVDCPECRQPFENSRIGTPDRLACPHCRETGTVLDEFESHCQMFRDGHGFS
jgi:hypothetical protein